MNTVVETEVVVKEALYQPFGLGLVYFHGRFKPVLSTPPARRLGVGSAPWYTTDDHSAEGLLLGCQP